MVKKWNNMKKQTSQPRQPAPSVTTAATESGPAPAPSGLAPPTLLPPAPPSKLCTCNVTPGPSKGKGKALALALVSKAMIEEMDKED